MPSSSALIPLVPAIETGEKLLPYYTMLAELSNRVSELQGSVAKLVRIVEALSELIENRN